ncbi:MAG: glycosyltransferase family 4 protein [Pseudomonadota bacterium]
MKVLILTTSYPRNDYDHSGIFVKRLAVAMAQSGANIIVLAPGDSEAKRKERDRVGIKVVRFSYAPRTLMRVAYGDGGIPENIRRWPWLFILLPFFVLSMAIHALIMARDCDVIHANWLSSGFVSIPARKIRKKPLIVTLRGSDLRGAFSKLLPFVAKRVDAITTVNKKWAEDLQKRLHSKIFYIPNGVEVAEEAINPRLKFSISTDEIIVLYIGVLCERKGTDILVNTAKIIYELNKSIRFLVVGPGDASQFGLDGLPNIIYAGQVPPHEALALYPGCDIFVLPSRFEGRPNALLEAMASGLPSIATRLPGVLEVLTEESGFLVNPEDPRAIAEAITALAKDPVRRKIMGGKAKARIEELSLDWESTARQYLSLFREALRCAV